MAGAGAVGAPAAGAAGRRRGAAQTRGADLAGPPLDFALDAPPMRIFMPHFDDSVDSATAITRPSSVRSSILRPTLVPDRQGIGNRHEHAACRRSRRSAPTRLPCRSRRPRTAARWRFPRHASVTETGHAMVENRRSPQHSVKRAQQVRRRGGWNARDTLRSTRGRPTLFAVRAHPPSPGSRRGFWRVICEEERSAIARSGGVCR